MSLRVICTWCKPKKDITQENYWQHWDKYHPEIDKTPKRKEENERTRH